MKTKKLIKNTLLILGLAFTMALVFSCKKKATTPEPTPTTTEVTCPGTYTYNVKIYRTAGSVIPLNYFISTICYGDTIGSYAPIDAYTTKYYPLYNVNAGSTSTTNVNYSFTENKKEGWLLDVMFMPQSPGYDPVNIEIYRDNILLWDTILNQIPINPGVIVFRKRRVSNSCSDSIINI